MEKTGSFMFEKSITKDQINSLPLKKYEGKTVIISNINALGGALAEIEKESVVGFDIERRPSFEKGVKHQVSLVQIAIPEKVFLFRVNILGIRPSLRRFFSNEEILKVGIGLDDDLASLQEMARFKPAAFLDLNKAAANLEVENVGLRNLTAIFLGFRISKRQQVSNWERVKLTENQINYAAMDAWACLQIYNRLSYWGYDLGL